MTTVKRLIAAIVFVCTLAFSFQGTGPQPIPECKGEECRDDYGNIQKGQPRFCINFDSPKYKKNCSCMRDCDNEFAVGCVRHCGKKGCMCDHGCGSTK
jgi:hypothetical protein